MPLANISSGEARRCTATCKARGDRCLNPAAWGCATCRYHGARRPSSIRRGTEHWNYHHGQQTLETKAERSRRLAELRDVESWMFALEMVVPGSPRWRGRKPKIVR